jgi:hypothetical protein|tara:strand:+ start:1558 stop:1953 length:396 start_codon:yes stop_codon:yes gene_type:complete
MANQFVHGLSETVTPQVPQFESDGEFLAWAFKNLSEAIKNLNERCNKIEEALQKIPPPGPDMIKYKIPGHEDYSNLLVLFDNLFARLDHIEVMQPENMKSLYEALNTLTERINKLDGSVHTGDREELPQSD